MEKFPTTQASIEKRGQEKVEGYIDPNTSKDERSIADSEREVFEKISLLKKQNPYTYECFDIALDIYLCDSSEFSEKGKMELKNLENDLREYLGDSMAPAEPSSYLPLFLVNKIDLTDKINIEKKIWIMESVHHDMLYASDDMSWLDVSKDHFSRFKRVVEEKVDMPNNNYFLNDYLVSILNTKGKFNRGQFDQDYFPKKEYVTKDRFIVRTNKRYKVTKKKRAQWENPYWDSFLPRPDSYDYKTEYYISFSKKENEIFDKKQRVELPLLYDQLEQAKGKKEKFEIKKKIKEIEQWLGGYAAMPGTPLRDIAYLGVVDKIDEAQEVQLEENYVNFMSGPVRLLVEKKFGVLLKDLSIPEQFQFLRYLKTSSVAEAEKVRNFTNKFGRLAFRSFLSVEHGGKEMGDKILSLGEVLPKEEAEKIFAHYSKIVDTTNETLDFIVSKYHKENITPEIVQKIKNTLLEKGAKLLRDTSQSLEKEKDVKEISQEIITLLDQYQENILLFASTFKTLSEEEKDLSLEDVAGTEIQKFGRADIERYKEDIVAINRDNRKEFMSEGELAKRTERLLETFKKDNVQFYGTTFEGKLVSFVSFEEQSDGSLLAESLNVAPSIKQSHIGNAFFETLVKDLGKEKDIYGYVHKKNADKLSFYEKLGFVTTPIIKDDGSEWYMIRYHTDAGVTKLAA